MAEYIISSGVSSSNLTLNSGDTMQVLDGGKVSNITPMKGAVVTFESGASGSRIIASGIQNETVLTGGYYVISSGATVTDGFGIRNGYAVVEGGDLINFTGNLGGSIKISSGTVRNAILMTNARVYAWGGVVDGIDMQQTNYVYVWGGEVKNITMQGGGEISLAYSGAGAATATNVTINGTGSYILGVADTHKGTLTINNAASTVSFGTGSILDFTVAGRTTSDDYLVNNWSLIDAMNGSVTLTTDAALTAGTYLLAQGAAAFDKSVTLKAGGAALGTITISGDTAFYNGNVYSLDLTEGDLKLNVIDGENYPARVYSSGTLTFAGNVISGGAIATGGNDSAVVTLGGTIDGARVNNEDTYIYLSGGSGVNLSAYGSRIGTSGSLGNGGLLIGGGVIAVSAGASATDTHLYTYGIARVCDGGYMSGVVEETNAVMQVIGGVVSNVTLIGTARIYLTGEQGGVVDTVTANAHGYVYVWNGEVRNITVASNADIDLTFAGAGTVTNVTMNGAGTYRLGSGDTHKGTLIINNAASTIAFNTGSILDFTVSDWATTSGYLINDYSLIDAMNGSVTLTVKNDQAAGTYGLAQGADAFAKTVTIQTASGSFGSLTANGYGVWSDGKLYELKLADGDLTLDVTDVAEVPVKLYNDGVLTSSGVYIYGNRAVLGDNQSAVVNDHGVLDYFVISGGGVVYLSGGEGRNLIPYNGGAIEVSSGAKLLDTAPGNAGTVTVYDGAYVSTITLPYTTKLHVSGGLVENVAVNLGGYVYASSGVVDGIFTNAGGRCYIALYNGEVRNVTIRGTGTEGARGYLNGALSTEIGTAVNVTLEDHSYYQLGSGDTHKGTLTINGEDTSVVFNNFATLDFTVAGRTTSADYLINNLGAVTLGASTYVTLTVNADQALGSYKLAQEAASFNRNVTLTDGETDYGTLTVNGDAVTYNYRTYQLLEADGNLTLSVTGPRPEIGPASFEATSDGALYSAQVYSELGSAFLQYKIDDGEWTDATSGSVLVTSSGELFLRAIDAYDQVSDAESYQVLVGTQSQFVGTPDASGNVIADIAGSVTGAVYGGGNNVDASGNVQLRIENGTLGNFAAGGAHVSGESRQTTGNVTLDLTGVTLNSGATARIIAGGLVSNSGSYTIGGDLNVDLDGVSAASITYGGARVESGSTFELAGDLNLSIASGSYQAVYAAGNAIKNGGDLIYDQDVNLTISGGTFTSYVGTGAQVSTGTSCTVAGDTNLTISGGTFNKQVFGGAYSQGGDATVEGNVYLTITGGTFNGNIYAGGYATGGNSAKNLVKGSTYVTLDASVNTITFGSNAALFGGSVDYGVVNGDSHLTITGTDANLVFTGNNVLMGDSLMYQDSRQAYVKGTRYITFDNYVGSMSAVLYAYQDLTIENGSQVSFDAGQSYLKNISTWNLELDAAAPVLAIAGVNNFYHDTLNLTFDEGISGATVVDGGSLDSLKNWDKLSAVTFNGAAAEWSDEMSAFVDADEKWSLSLGGDNDLVLAKLA